jgi:hypothetical protein
MAVDSKNLIKTKLAIQVLVIFLVARLAFAAMDSGNWRGFFYSSLHVLFVAAITYLTLQRTMKE